MLWLKGAHKQQRRNFFPSLIIFSYYSHACTYKSILQSICLNFPPFHSYDIHFLCSPTYDCNDCKTYIHIKHLKFDVSRNEWNENRLDYLIRHSYWTWGLKWNIKEQKWINFIIYCLEFSWATQLLHINLSRMNLRKINSFKKVSSLLIIKKMWWKLQ